MIIVIINKVLYKMMILILLLILVKGDVPFPNYYIILTLIIGLLVSVISSIPTSLWEK
jgi:hypothetical protein